MVCPQGTFMHSRFLQQSSDYINWRLKSAHLKWVKAEETSSPFGHDVKYICHTDVDVGTVQEKYFSTSWLMPVYIFINALCLGQLKRSVSKPNKSPHLTDTIKKPQTYLIPFIIMIFLAVTLLCQDVVFLAFFLSFAYMTWSIHNQGAMKIRGCKSFSCWHACFSITSYQKNTWETMRD